MQSASISMFVTTNDGRWCIQLDAKKQNSKTRKIHTDIVVESLWHLNGICCSWIIDKFVSWFLSDSHKTPNKQIMSNIFGCSFGFDLPFSTARNRFQMHIWTLHCLILESEHLHDHDVRLSEQLFSYSKTKLHEIYETVHSKCTQII